MSTEKIAFLKSDSYIAPPYTARLYNWELKDILKKLKKPISYLIKNQIGTRENIYDILGLGTRSLTLFGLLASHTKKEDFENVISI